MIIAAINDMCELKSRQEQFVVVCCRLVTSMSVWNAQGAWQVVKRSSNTQAFYLFMVL